MTAEILTVQEMYAADRWAMDHGVSGIELMENAGAACAEAIMEALDPCPVAVLCGPGNNGGDGFVIARLLADEGWPVDLYLLGDLDKLQGDAAHMAGLWTGATKSLKDFALSETGLVVDAIFGAGLSRDIEGDLSDLIEQVNTSGVPVMAVDVPSGIDGDTGAVRGTAFEVDFTVTFFRPKPAHLLLPGRTHCGAGIVADIGIPEDALDDIQPKQFRNGPDLWGDRYPWPTLDGHKYSRGHGIVLAGPAHATGAARLAAYAALRAGAGLMTIAADQTAVPILAAQVTSVMIHPLDEDGFERAISDPRRNGVLIGPGCGVTNDTRKAALAALRAGKHVVLDADALTVFADDPAFLFAEIARAEGEVVLTPHEGEFGRLFPDVQGDRLSRTREAARRCGATVILKGPDSVIAGPDGLAVINDNAPPYLATAGSGDVLAGLVLGLLCQGVSGIDSAAMAVWLHGACAEKVGPGLIAEDLADQMPLVLAELLEFSDI